jgi:hypothetical protein
MFVADETVNQKSHVTFFRCSLCVSEHVSSEPILQTQVESVSQANGLLAQAALRAYYAV